MAGHVPTVRSRRLRFELRRLREQTDYTYEQVADALGWSGSKVYRIETDKVGVIPRDVNRMLDLYGVEKGERRDALIALSRDKGHENGWWHRYGDVLPEWFQVYVSLESEAETLREYESELVPGLLQTEDYAQAILQTAPNTEPDDEIERTVAARLARQEALTRERNPVRFWAVLNEAVARRMVGGPKTMASQLLHLVEMSRLPNVAIQIMPFDVGAHAAMRSSFHILRFPESTDRHVVYVETQTGSLYMEDPADVERYILMYDYLRGKALGAEESAEWMRQVAKVL